MQLQLLQIQSQIPKKPVFAGNMGNMVERMSGQMDRIDTIFRAINNLPDDSDKWEDEDVEIITSL